MDLVAVARPSSGVHWESSLVSSSFAEASYVEVADLAFVLDEVVLDSSASFGLDLDELQEANYVGLHLGPLRGQYLGPCFYDFGDH